MESIIYRLLVVVSSFRSIASGSIKPTRESIPLTDNQKLQIVEMHNEFRRRRYSSDMRYMTWDGELAWLAESYGRKCRFLPSKTRLHSTYSSVGENMFATRYTKNFSGTTAVQEWFEEMSSFKYRPNVCRANKSCENYTQIVWASTYKVGCALTHCRFITEISLRDGLLFFCNYAPSGNILDSEGRLKEVYKRGHACTLCEDDDYCRNKLCANSKRDFIEPPNTVTEVDVNKYTAIICTLSLTVFCLLCFILIRQFHFSISCDKILSITSRSANCHAKHVSQTSRDDSAVNNKAPLLDQKINEENQCELNKVAEEPDPTNTSVVCQVKKDGNEKDQTPSRRASRISLPKPLHPAPRSPPPAFPAPVLERFSQIAA